MSTKLDSIVWSKKRIQTIHRNLLFFSYLLPLPLRSKVICFFDIWTCQKSFSYLKTLRLFNRRYQKIIAFKISSLDRKAYCVLFRWNNGLRQGCFFNPVYFYEDEVQDKLPVISAQININKTTAIFFLV